MILDPFQKKAIEYIQDGHSVIVAAPTGAGKTVIAEHVIQDGLETGRKVIYTAPIKALSNQKFREFDKNFPGQVGILTGDISLNTEAPTLIMTTEIFRNKILEEKASLHDYSWIIFDEIHYLDDYERGSVWEESLIFLPDHMKILGLSATIPNIDELAQWLRTIHHRSIKIIKEDKRPVPLHIFYQCQGKTYDDMNKVVKEGFRSSGYKHYRGRMPRSVHLKPNRLDSLIDYLQQKDLLPCIYFAFSRKRTEYLAEELQVYDFLNDEEREEISRLYDELVDRFDIAGEVSVEKLRPFIQRGIAYHHAGMLPTLKEVVERLFTSRLIKAIFTTETFALGINMPARTVIFDELRKYYGYAFSHLKTRDFYQMAGRAGRRSIDTEGFVFCRLNPHYISPLQLNKVVYGKPEKISSRFNASYATILNLYQNYGEKLYDIYPLSFHFFQEGKFHQKKAVELLRAKVKLLKELGYIRKNRITEKGLFASKVYGYELILAELFESGVLEEMSTTQLGILTVGIVYEPRKGMSIPYLSRQAKSLDKMTSGVMRRLQRIEHSFRIKPLSKKAFFHLASAMEAWLKGEEFEKILSLTETDEGEVVRYFRMTMQILRDLYETPVSKELKDRIQKLTAAINRGVIDSEKQLRI